MNEGEKNVGSLGTWRIRDRMRMMSTFVQFSSRRAPSEDSRSAKDIATSGLGTLVQHRCLAAVISIVAIFFLTSSHHRHHPHEYHHCTITNIAIITTITIMEHGHECIERRRRHHSQSSSTQH